MVSEPVRGVLNGPLAVTPCELLKDQVPVQDRQVGLESVLGQPPQGGRILRVPEAEVSQRKSIAVPPRPARIARRHGQGVGAG